MPDEPRRVALVTGAGRGLGLAIAEQLAAMGMKVIIGGRDEQQGLAARNRICDSNGEAYYVRLDVTDPTTIVAAVGHITDTHQRLDVLVNNAGIMVDGDTSILELPLTLLQNTLETNAFGPLLLSQVCMPLMKAQQYGRIVNISSTLGALSEITNPESSYAEMQTPAYRLSKSVLNSITVMLAKELRGSNILVNSVCPGWVRTDMGGPQAPLSTEEAAATPVWLATLPDDGPSGGFFREQQPIPW